MRVADILNHAQAGTVNVIMKLDLGEGQQASLTLPHRVQTDTSLIDKLYHDAGVRIELV